MVLHHVLAVLALLWLLSSCGWSHPLAYFVSFFYLYLVNERYAVRLRKRLQHEERLNASEKKAFADFESVHWLNHAVAKVWPICMEQIASQQILLPMIPWFLDRYKPWTAREAVLQHLYLGKKPPEINKIKVHAQSSNNNHLVLELGMNFVSGDDMHAIFTVKLRKRLGLGLRARMHVTGIHLEGKALVGVKFLHQWPYLGRVTMSFVEPPYFQMTAKPIFHHGLDVTELPGIAGWLDRIFSIAFQQTLVQPNQLVLDVKKHVLNEAENWFTVHEKTPIAYAEMEIVEGVDMKPLNLDGLAEPYVKGRLGHYRFCTKVQSKTLSPKWLEEYLIPITSWDDSNLLALEVCNKDRIFDDSLGNCIVDISKLRDGQRHDIWLSLENIEMGKLHIALRILEAEDLKGNDVFEDATIEKTIETETNALPTAKVKCEHVKPATPSGRLSKMKEKMERVIDEWKEKTTARELERVFDEWKEKTTAWVHHPANDTSEAWEPLKGSSLQSKTYPFQCEGAPSQRLDMPTSQCGSTDLREEKQDAWRTRSVAELKRGLKRVGTALHRDPKNRSSAESVVLQKVSSP